MRPVKYVGSFMLAFLTFPKFLGGLFLNVPSSIKQSRLGISLESVNFQFLIFNILDQLPMVNILMLEAQ